MEEVLLELEEDGGEGIDDGEGDSRGGELVFEFGWQIGVGEVDVRGGVDAGRERGVLGQFLDKVFREEDLDIGQWDMGVEVDDDEEGLFGFGVDA